MGESSPTVSVVVPVFNAERSLDELIARIAGLGASSRVIEIILVDDGSADRSWEVIQALASAHPLVVGVALSRNYGQHPALLAGIQRAKGDLIVTMDDDLQHRPEDIRLLVDAVAGGADLAYGRAIVEEHGIYRNLTSRAAKGAIAAAAGGDIARLASGFRCFPGEFRAVLLEPRGPYVSLDVLLSWIAREVVGVPVQMDQRRYGTSNYSTAKLVRHGLNMVLGFSTAPLRMVSYMGVLVGLLGAVLLLFVLIRYVLVGSTVPGFAFVASMVALFSGVQLLALGIIGEYMARLYVGAIKRPAYVVRAVVETRNERRR